ncbi:rCG37622 [Rattus norvegicus]|uniref:RCG37622 n=1 Tax=Rattus norvegicus TaxID=10116 RepID=A6K816_RAT|nr:rCG37622 [Rattus norvegicus]
MDSPYRMNLLTVQMGPPASVHLIKIILRGHAQKSIPQVILEPVKLAINTNHNNILVDRFLSL